MDVPLQKLNETLPLWSPFTNQTAMRRSSDPCTAAWLPGRPHHGTGHWQLAVWRAWSRKAHTIAIQFIAHCNSGRSRSSHWYVHRHTHSVKAGIWTDMDGYVGVRTCHRAAQIIRFGLTRLTFRTPTICSLLATSLTLISVDVDPNHKKIHQHHLHARGTSNNLSPQVIWIMSMYCMQVSQLILSTSI